MSNLTQTIRNSFIRIVGFLSVTWQMLASFVIKFFSFFGKLLGVSKSTYFIESDSNKTGDQQNKQPLTKVEDSTPKILAPNSPSSKNSKVDNYYLNMAREVKKS